MNTTPTSTKRGLRLFMSGALAAAILSAPAVVADAATAAGESCGGQPATIVGTPGNDDIEGTPGNDVIVGLDGRDYIDGGKGDDIICGNDNPRELDLDGLLIPQWMQGGPGNDQLFGGDGADQIHGDLGDDTMEGGGGPDELFSGSLRGGFRNRPYGGFDHLSGGSGDDELVGWDSRVVESGGQGDDRLIGGPLNDRLNGDAGRDTLAGDEGDDEITGGADPDILDFHVDHHFLGNGSHHRGVTVNLTTGTATGKAWGTDTLTDHFEKVWTGDGRDHVIGDDRDNVIYTGFGRSDTVEGRGGRDLITFEHYKIDGTCCQAVRVDLAEGSGNVESPYGGRTKLSIRGVEDLVGGYAPDVLLGNARPNRIFGGDESAFKGGDIIKGRGGNDRIFGGAGPDNLDGGPGNNFINGGKGGSDTCRNPASGPGCEMPG